MVLQPGDRDSANTDRSIPSHSPVPSAISQEQSAVPALPAERQSSAVAPKIGFTQVQAASAEPVSDRAPGESLVGYLKVDLSHLDQVLREIRPGAPANVQIAFPLRNGRSAVAAFRILRPLSTDGDSWQLQGAVQGAEHSSAVLTKWKGAIFGSVSASEDGDLEWRQQKDGRIAVYRFDAASLPDCDTDGLADHKPEEHEDPAQPLLAAPSPEPPVAAAATKNVIDVVVGYNHQARISLGGSASIPTDVAAIEAKIMTALADADAAYSASAIDLEMRIAWMGLIDYTYPVGEFFDRALDEISDEADGIADELSRKKTEYQADFACLWVDSSVTGGLATVITSAGNWHRAYSVVRAKNPTATFAHEIGHNMGCRHLRDGYATTPSSWAPYAFAHQFLGLDGKTYLTVMASTGDESRTGGTRILRFSNPRVLYQSRATGVADVSDCARHLQEIRQVLEDFRPSPPKDVRITRAGTQTRLTIGKGLVGKRYSLWRSPDFSTWSPLGFATTNSIGEAVRSDGTALPKAFYRWQAEP